jgi:hypothetical protein
MPPSQHARLGASNAHRWMNCTGAPRMAEGMPEIEEEYMIEGRAAHAYAEQMLRGEPLLDHVTVDTEDGKREFPVDDEMREGVALFVDTVRKARQELGGNSEMLIEQRVNLSLIGLPEMFGTADVILHGLVDAPARRVLQVYDLKYGRGVVVEVKNNVQLLYYVLGAVLMVANRALMAGALNVERDEDMLSEALSLFDEILITIVQPRAPHIDGPVRTAWVTREEIKDFAKLLILKAVAAGTSDAPLTPGSWCRFCPAQGTCPALKRQASLVAQMDFAAVPMDTPPDPEHLSLAVVADVLQQVPILEAWIAAMYRRVTVELEAGRQVPGWKLVPKRAVRKWADEAETMQWLEQSGIPAKEAFEPWTLKSPAGIEKIIGKNIIPDALITKESSGTNLVPDSDPRPAAAVGPAEEFLMLPPPQENS